MFEGISNCPLYRSPIPSPLQKLKIGDAETPVWIKRDDLLHPIVSGNKWRKLKYNLQYVLESKMEGVVSFGGAFSNHLYALAGACDLLGLKSVGFVRTEKLDKANPTLQFLESKGMSLYPIDRTSYRNKNNAKFLDSIGSQFPNYHLVPEGGSNLLAIEGVTEIIEECRSQIDNGTSLYVCGVGSGTTLAGLVKGLDSKDRVYGISAVNDLSLEAKINAYLNESEQSMYDLDYNGTFGGFAKTEKSLIEFINSFYKNYYIPLDTVYNGKVMFRFLQLLEQDRFSAFDNIIVIHTGGLQGLKAFDYLNPGLLRSELICL